MQPALDIYTSSLHKELVALFSKPVPCYRPEPLCLLPILPIRRGVPSICGNRIVVGPQDEIDIMHIKFEDAVRDKNTPDELRAAYKDIVREFSRDNPEIIRNGGDMGWVPKGVHKDYEYRFLDLEIARLSEPTPDKEDPNKLFFFIVSERSPSRDIEPRNIDKLKTEALQNWLNDERQNHQVHAELNSFIYAWIIEQLRLTDTSPTPTPDPLQQFLRTQ